MDHRAVILDGITVQHVGEVLFDSGTTAGIRSQCRETYLHSLEDFAFAFLFGETLTLSGRMPPVGDETPGGTLIQQCELSDILVPVDMGPPTSTQTLLQERDFRYVVERDIEAVDKLRGTDLELFSHFFVREAPAYLGDHASLRETGLDAGAYVFETDHRTSHYVQDPQLQNLIKPAFSQRMIVAMRKAGVPIAVSDTALAEFVSRALLTHVANYWGFDRAVEGQPHGSARLPHVTRAAIRHKVDAPLDPGREARLKRLVYKGVVPHALLRVLGVARQKGLFLEALREVRDSRDFTEIRRYLSELVVQLDAGDRRDADQLMAEIARKTGQGSVKAEPFELNVPVVGSLKFSGSLKDGWERYWNPGKYYLRQLVRESAYAGGSEYEERVARFFPELRGDA